MLRPGVWPDSAIHIPHYNRRATELNNLSVGFGYCSMIHFYLMTVGALALAPFVADDYGTDVERPLDGRNWRNRLTWPFFKSLSESKGVLRSQGNEALIWGWVGLGRDVFCGFA